MDGDDSDGDGVDHGSVSISQRATVDAHQYPIELMCSFCVYLYSTVVYAFSWRILHDQCGCIIVISYVLMLFML